MNEDRRAAFGTTEALRRQHDQPPEKWGAAVRNCYDTRNRKSGAGARTGYLASLFRFQGAVCEAHADESTVGLDGWTLARRPDWPDTPPGSGTPKLASVGVNPLTKPPWADW
jgi:hypothetical protein